MVASVHGSCVCVFVICVCVFGCGIPVSIEQVSVR